MIRTIIVDDEVLARDVIREFLINYPSIQVIGECDNGRDAIMTIDTEKPNLVFRRKEADLRCVHDDSPTLHTYEDGAFKSVVAQDLQHLQGVNS